MMIRLWRLLGWPVLFGLLSSLIILAWQPELVGFSRSNRDDLFNQSFRWLRRTPTSYRTAVEKAAPAVVNIATQTLTAENNPAIQPPTYRLADGRKIVQSTPLATSLGSGVIVSPDGLILTNNHVIRHADSIIVALTDNRKVKATIVGHDPETDLALLKIHLQNLPYMPVASTNTVAIGDVVLAIGNPLKLGQTVTMGIVSATERNDLQLNTYEDFIQTDAAINVGNSGGALVNADGDLVGINTSLLSRGGGSEGIGFAIPAAMTRFVIDSILQYGHVVRGWLGIDAQLLSPALARAFGVRPDVGILIAGVYKGSPASKAGLRRGDILTCMTGRKTSDGRKVMNIVAQQLPGSAVTMTVIRDGQKLTVKAHVGVRPTIVNQ